MAKDKISDYSSTANSNTDIAGINIDEGCAPSGINDAIRTLMAQLKTWQSGGQDVYIHPAGSASAPSITANGDTNTGIFFPAADTVAVTTGGSERARVDSAGNLGLNVTPSAWGSPFKAFQFGSNGGSLNYRTDSNQAIEFGLNYYYDGSNFKYINTNTASRYRQYNSQHEWYTAASGTAGNAITFTQAMTLDASGNLGLGTTSPGRRLNVAVAYSSGTIVPAIKIATVGGYDSNSGTGIDFGQDQGTYSTWVTGRIASPRTGSNWGGSLTFLTNNDSSDTALVERARIDSSGNFMVGTTSTIGSGSARLSVDGAGGVVAGIKSTGGATNECVFNWNNATSGNNLFNSFYTEATATGRGSIDYNRGAGLVRYNTTSDATLKNIIGDADGTKSVDILKSTRIREYSWKEDQANKPQIGVIAQELHETFSGAVSVGGDKVEVDEEGNETTRYIPWAVDKTAFTFHLVAGWQAHEKIIQEQQAMIASQSAIITQLQADVAALKG